MGDEDIDELNGLGYARDFDQALELVRSTAYDAAFFTAPDADGAVAGGGPRGREHAGRVPPLFPKVASGLVFNPLVDGRGALARVTAARALPTQKWKTAQRRRGLPQTAAMARRMWKSQRSGQFPRFASRRRRSRGGATGPRGDRNGHPNQGTEQQPRKLSR